MTGKHWRPEEEEELLRAGAGRSIQELAEELGRSPRAIILKGRLLGIPRQCLGCGGEIRWGSDCCNPCAARARWRCGVYANAFTSETRRKQSEAAKARIARDGVIFTPETRRNLSKAVRAAWARGDMDSIHTTPEARRKHSEAAMAAWARGGGLGSLEHRRKLSKAMKAARARGTHDSPETRRRMSEASKAKWACGIYDGVFQSPTSIELAVAVALDDFGIEHVSQCRPDGCRFTFDEFVPLDMLVEVNGDYWHGPNRPGVQERDAVKAVWAKGNGYRLVILWEHEIHKHGAHMLLYERVLPLL